MHLVSQSLDWITFAASRISYAFSAKSAELLSERGKQNYACEQGVQVGEGKGELEEW